MAKRDEADFQDRLFSEMERRGWKRADLARALGVSPSHISKLLTGKSKPSAQLVITMARHFGVEDTWLARGEGPKRRRKQAPALSSAEVDLLESWGRLSQGERDSITEVIRLILAARGIADEQEP